MHYSGLLILTRPRDLTTCAQEVAQCAGVEVYVTDETTGRIVAAMETTTLEEQQVGLRRVQELPHVQQAMLVYHYFGDEEVLEADPNTPVRTDDGQSPGAAPDRPVRIAPTS